MKQRISKSCYCESHIQPSAPRTNCKLLAGEVKRTFRNLVAEIAEGLVDRTAEREMIALLSDRRSYDGSDYDHTERRHREPNKIRRERFALESNFIRGATRNFHSHN